MDNRVYLLRVDSYHPDALDEAVNMFWGPLGLDSLLQGKQVLIKPNLVAGASPDKAVCTHPEVIGALIRQLQGSKVSVGDSPGLGSTENVAAIAGILEVCQREGATLVDFANPVVTETPDGAVCRIIQLAEAVLRADAVISAAKLKTHALTRYTGAVKNLFGCMPGKLKPEMHLRMEEIDKFASFLVDVYLTVSPVLSVVDGIVAMEGNGPRNGEPRKVGVLLAGRDGVAVDAVAASVIGLDPFSVPTILNAHQRGVGCGDLRSIEIIGTSLSEARIRGFKTVPGSSSALKNLPPFLKSLLRDQLTAKPVVNVQSCIGCTVCRELCPTKAITMDKAAVISSHDCIRCYCCQELCPEGAITLARRGLGRLFS
ncbi:MAG: DUF362 domain-containing protein [Clostridiales bacterium]|jgi:uncharacterized protein (DUF362 family)/Pyruvate/2-oxoacid:ferredoxin oxidoreductase delta subunit|nr:DUF362 domain-containing protein [Clostridiales bacterium]